MREREDKRTLETDAGLFNHRRYLNRQRTCICCSAVLVMQALNIVGIGCELGGLLTLGAAGLIACSVLYPALAMVVFKDSPRLKRFPYYMLYWTALCIGMVPFIAADEASLFPYNALLLCLMLALFPVFTRKEAVYIAAVYTICNIIAAIAYRYDTEYIVCLAAVSVGAFLVGRTMSRSYLALVKKLLDDSLTDYHTSLLNRRGGFERLAQAMAYCRRSGEYCAVMMIDIDDFKLYNDTYGHSCGDEALKNVAQALGEKFKRNTDVIFRYGGEEFVAAFTIKDKTLIAEIASGLLEAIGRLEIMTAIKKKNLTASIGVAVMKPSETDTDCAALIGRADKEMYKAKEKGKNCFSIEE